MFRMKADTLLSVLALGAVIMTVPRAADGVGGQQKPNIVVIVADDLGYADLGCQGGTEMKTPRIDSLAEEGMRFTNAYVTGPVCAPTRAGLMTGRYQARFGYENLTQGVEIQIQTDRGVSTNEIFIPELLKPIGYTTGAIGKWHLGYNQKYRPNNRGFDYFFGFLPGGHPYFDWTTPERGTMGGSIYKNGDTVEGEGYLTERFTQEAVDFIERNKEKRFFLYLTYFNVHGPLTVPDEYCEALPKDMDPLRRKMVGMIRALDAGVGDVLRALHEMELEKNTLVIFLGDNGGVNRPHVSNKPLSGGKATLLEGGIRVPFLVKWPGKVPQGSTYDKPVVSLDVLPTLVSAAGGSLPEDREIDGVDLTPYITGADKGNPHDVLFWRYGREGHALAIRRGNMKLVCNKRMPPRLFDLAEDIGEKRDLSRERPAVAKQLFDELKAWNDKMPKVAW